MVIHGHIRAEVWSAAGRPTWGVTSSPRACWSRTAAAPRQREQCPLAEILKPLSALRVNTANSPRTQGNLRVVRPGAVAQEWQSSCSKSRTCSLSPLHHPCGLSPPRVTARITGTPPSSTGSGGQRYLGPGRGGQPAGTHRRPPPGMLLPDVRCLLRLLFRYK